MLPEFHVGIEAAVVELLLEGVHRKPHFFLVEDLVQQLAFRLAHPVKQAGVGGNLLHSCLDLLEIIRRSKGLLPMGV